MANPNNIIELPPVAGASKGTAVQFTDTILTDTQGTWNTYILPDGAYVGAGFTIKAPSTAVVKLQASCDSNDEIYGRSANDIAAQVAAGTFTGWTQAVVGNKVTFTASSTGVRNGTYQFTADNNTSGNLVVSSAGVAAVNAVFTLTITAAATGTGNVGVALNGGANVNTAVTSGDTIAQVATKIAATSFSGYTVTNPSAGVVVFTATTPGPQTGANTLTPNATGVTGAIVATTPGVTATSTIAVLTVASAATQYGTAQVTLNGTTTAVSLTQAGSQATWVDIPSATSTGGTGYVGGLAYAVTALRSVIGTALASNVATVSIRTNSQKYW